MNYYEYLIETYRKKNKPPLVLLDKKIPIRPNLSHGVNRLFTEAVGFHNTGDDDVPAGNYYDWMKNPNYTAYASYHCLNARDAKIWQLFEWELECFGSGSEDYTEIGMTRFKSQAWRYTVDMEFTTTYKDGIEYYISPEQLLSGAEWGAEMCISFNLKRPTEGGFIRHGDIALDRPECPKHLMDEYRWKRFCQLGDYFYDRKRINI